jgi:glycosyltransferase involved in cell wall biosynthesis
MRTYRGFLFPQHLATLEEVAERIDSDVIYVSKPRLPSYGLGILAKAFRNRPLILDCDDREVSFFGSGNGNALVGGLEFASQISEPEFYNPFGALWTRNCESMVNLADHVTVSNHTLQALYGGTVIPHARDERIFDPALYDPDQARYELGLEAGQRMILFAGTPRKHKGIQQIVAALAEIGDPRNRLGVIATGDLDQVFKELGPLRSWIQELPVQPFDRLPALLSAADLTCILQDPQSEVSRYQIPAKITDALAMGLPCIATTVPPLEPLIARGAIRGVSAAPLHTLIDEVLGDPVSAREAALAQREVFLDEFSYTAVRLKIEKIIDGLVAEPPKMPAELKELVDFQRKTFFSNGTSAGTNGSAGAKALEFRPKSLSPALNPAMISTASPAETGGAPYDIVVFWKHNDSGIYGRRQDMVVKYLARSEKVNQIIHFDAPVDLRWIRRNLKPQESQANHARLLALQTLGRLRGTERQPKVKSYTYLHRADSGNGNRSLGSALLPPADRYADWISSVLRRNGVGRRTTVFWAYPRLFGFPEIADALAPDVIVSDVVDDDRTWVDPGSDHYQTITHNYREILQRSHIVLASNESAREAMKLFAPEIHLMPNGCEYPAPPTSGAVPRELRGMRGPIIGYVGNLSSRIDIPLLERLVTAHPEWNLVLIGSAHLDQQILGLQRYPNVHVLGVKPYEKAQQYIKAFNVAIIPHLDDRMTRAMHPLKAFVYATHNVPIVSTDIANLGELREFMHIGKDSSEFIWRVELALASGKPKSLPAGLDAALSQNSWARRTEVAFGLLDAHVSSSSLPGIGVLR